MDTEQQAAEAVNEHVEEQAAAVDQQFAEADAQANPDAETPPSLEDIASKAGWVPQDKFRGPARGRVIMSNDRADRASQVAARAPPTHRTERSPKLKLALPEESGRSWRQSAALRAGSTTRATASPTSPRATITTESKA
jgi:hypothetical protein